MANPRALAMQRLREKEELARQAAILGAEKRRGIMSSLPTNLGSIGKFISDDNNDLDNLSFSTDKGLKVNLQNNRNKEAGDPKVKLADMDFSNLSSVGSNVHPRITAMDNNRTHEAWEVAQQIKEEWKNGIKNWGTVDTSALDSFIEKNSAAPKLNGSGGFMSNRNPGGNSVLPEDSIMHPDNLNKNQGYSQSELDQIELDYQTEHGSRFKGDSSRIPPVGFAPDAGLQLDPEIQAYGNIPELDESIREQAIRSGMTAEELDELLLEMEIQENKELAKFKGDSSRIPPAGSAMQPRWEGTGDQNMGYKMPVEDEESLREAAIRTGMSQEELDDLMLYQAQINSTTPDSLGPLGEQPEQPLDGNNDLEIGNEKFQLPENFEALDQVVSEWRLNNPEKAAESDRLNEIAAANREDQIMAEWEAENPELAELEAEEKKRISMEENISSRHPPEDFLVDSGPKLDEDSLIYDEIKQEKDTKEAYIQLSNTMAPEDLAAVEEEVTSIEETAGEDGQEVTESKLSDLFGSLKDIFGVDNKSLLRALVKYIGGRVFGLSSGKAAQFAWAGIEADMATNAAKGADARAYQDNMDEYDKMYDAALEEGKKTGNFDEANRILQKMNSLSGVEKSDAEKFDDNISYLNKKYNEAKKANDTVKMSQIAKQLKAMEAAGIDGTKADTWMGSAGMYDKNGTYVVKQAMQVDGQGLKVYDEASGTFKLPSELGYRDAIRTTTSDTGTEKYAVDERIITDPEDYNAFSTEIPNAISVSPKGVPKFDEGTNEANKMASFSHTSVKSIMMMEDMLSHSDQVRQEIFSLQAEFKKSIADQASDSAMKGVLAKFIKRDMSPAAKLWFNDMNTLVTSKLRRETGAAYNKEELITTMNFFPNASDYPKNFSELDREGKTEALKYLNLRMSQTSNWILTNAQGLEAHEYLEGLHSGLFRPDDNWLKLNREMIEYLDSRYKPTVSVSTAALIPTT